MVIACPQSQIELSNLPDWCFNCYQRDHSGFGDSYQKNWFFEPFLAKSGIFKGIRGQDGTSQLHCKKVFCSVLYGAYFDGVKL